MRSFKREIPVLVAGLVGFLMVFEYFFKSDTLNAWGIEAQNWGVIIAAFALGLAAVGLVKTHTGRIIERRGEWYNSVLLLIALAVAVISGLISRQSSTFKFIFENMITPLGAAFYSMIAFYLLSAAYRAFRARSFEATALLVAGCIVMLGRAPIGEVIWSQFPALANWIMQCPNVAGSRGVLIGAAVGTVGSGLRIILGIDRGYLGGQE
ncbi:MAG: hypothetical protein ACOYEQ_04890 [Bacillota bacterium]